MLARIQDSRRGTHICFCSPVIQHSRCLPRQQLELRHTLQSMLHNSVGLFCHHINFHVAYACSNTCISSLDSPAASAMSWAPVPFTATASPAGGCRAAAAFVLDREGGVEPAPVLDGGLEPAPVLDGGLEPTE